MINTHFLGASQKIYKKTEVFDMYPNLELEMFKQKITGREMAQRLGIGESTMYKKLRGEFDFKLKEVEKILDIFPGVDWRVLFARADEKGKAG